MLHVAALPELRCAGEIFIAATPAGFCAPTDVTSQRSHARCLLRAGEFGNRIIKPSKNCSVDPLSTNKCLMQRRSLLQDDGRVKTRCAGPVKNPDGIRAIAMRVQDPAEGYSPFQPRQGDIRAVRPVCPFRMYICSPMLSGGMGLYRRLFDPTRVVCCMRLRLPACAVPTCA